MHHKQLLISLIVPLYLLAMEPEKPSSVIIQSKDKKQFKVAHNLYQTSPVLQANAQWTPAFHTGADHTITAAFIQLMEKNRQLGITSKDDVAKLARLAYFCRPLVVGSLLNNAKDTTPSIALLRLATELKIDTLAHAIAHCAMQNLPVLTQQQAAQFDFGHLANQVPTCQGIVVYPRTLLMPNNTKSFNAQDVQMLKKLQYQLYGRSTRKPCYLPLLNTNPACATADLALLAYTNGLEHIGDTITQVLTKHSPEQVSRLFNIIPESVHDRMFASITVCAQIFPELLSRLARLKKSEMRKEIVNKLCSFVATDQFSILLRHPDIVADSENMRLFSRSLRYHFDVDSYLKEMEKFFSVYYLPQTRIALEGNKDHPMFSTVLELFAKQFESKDISAEQQFIEPLQVLLHQQDPFVCSDYATAPAIVYNAEYFKKALQLWKLTCQFRTDSKKMVPLCAVTRYYLSKMSNRIPLATWEKFCTQYPKMLKALRLQEVVHDQEVFLFDTKVAKISSKIPANTDVSTILILKGIVYKFFELRCKHTGDPKALEKAIEKFIDKAFYGCSVISFAHAWKLPHIAQRLTHALVKNCSVRSLQRLVQEFPAECDLYLAPEIEPTCENLIWLLWNYSKAIDARYITNPQKCFVVLIDFIMKNRHRLLANQDFVQAMEDPHIQSFTSEMKNYLAKRFCCAQKDSVIQMIKDHETDLQWIRSLNYYDEDQAAQTDIETGNASINSRYFRSSA